VKPIIPFALLLVTACHKDDAPAAPSADQSDRLNATEDMLNSMDQNEEGPADRSAGPSNRSN